MKKNRGFTLIELMVVVIVIAILAAIALPSYLNQVRKSRRSEAEAAIQAAALFEERYRADCTSYAAFGATCSGSTVSMPTWSSIYSKTYYNAATTTAVSATAYKISITANSTYKQNNDSSNGTSCATLTYDYGVTTSGTVTKSPPDCWSK